MANKWGIHAANSPNAHNSGDYEAMLALGVSHYTVLHHEAKWCRAMRQASPDGIIQVRFYLSRWRDWQPREWANKCAWEYLEQRECPLTGVRFNLAELAVHVRPANEMNLAEESGGSSYQDYQDINRWLLEWLAEFVKLTGIPVERTHFPAFAYGHSDDQDDFGYIGEDLCREAITAYGIFDKHPYWFQPTEVTADWRGHRFKQSHDRFKSWGLNKKIFCAELGNFDVTRTSTPDEIIQWFESIYQFDYVLGGTPFIFRDPTGAHPVNDWGRNREIERRVKAHPKREVQAVSNFEVGHGFAKVEHLVGPWRHNEVWHGVGTDYETSMAIGERGHATWRKATNRTVAVCDNGEVFADDGNQGATVRKLDPK